MADYLERVTAERSIPGASRLKERGRAGREASRRSFQALRPATAIGLVSLALLGVLALSPFAVVVRESLGAPATLAYWRALLLGHATEVVPFWTSRHTVAFLWRPLWHSLVIAGLTTLLATGLGATLAWLSAMTNLRYRRALKAIALFHLVLPPFALAVAWLSLARAVRLPEAWTYGPAPMVLVLTLHFYAFAFLLIEMAARSVDASLIEAAVVHGASLRAILRRIVFPLLAPAVLAGAGLIAFSSLAAFAPMQVLSGGDRPYYVLATQVYSLYRNSLGDPRVGVFAVCLALVLTLVSLPPFLLFLRLLRDARRYESIGGRGHQTWVLDLERWREPVSLFCLSAALLTVVAPLSILLLESLSPGEGLGLSALSPDAYRALFATNQYALSLANSLLLATLAATVGVLVTLPIAYSIQRSDIAPLRGGLYLLTLLPFLLPGVVLGLAYFVLISRPYALGDATLSLRLLYGSLLLAVVVSTVKHLPLGVQTHASAIVQIDPALEEAAYVFGSSFRQAVARIFLPLLRSGALVAWMLLFIFAFKEIDVLVFVYAPLAFSTGSLGWEALTRAPPAMYRVFALMNAQEQPELRAQGIGLLLIACLILLAATLCAARLGWKPFKESAQG